MEKIIKKIKFNPNNNTNIIINLNNNFYDIGFYSDSGFSDETINTDTISKKVIGSSISRLNELKKYTNSENISDKYIISTNGSNGVLISETNENLITYLIDNIKYFDDLNDGSTTFEFNTPTKRNDLDKKILIKDDKYLNYIDYKEKKNLDIARQSLNIFESHIRLTDIRNVEELTLYGGRYYNIYVNS